MGRLRRGSGDARFENVREIARLLDDGLLHDRCDMKSCNIGVGIVVGKRNNISSFGIHCGVVRCGNSVFTSIARPNCKRDEWCAVQ